MIVSFKLKHLIGILLTLVFVLILGVTIYKAIKPTTHFLKPMQDILVVIDAGHGGIDGGSVGKTTGVYESELNLKYAKNLKERLEEMNITCYLTRQDENGLYDSSAKNLKRSDMKKRKEIIENISPKIVVSFHMNSFPLSSSRGAQTFYKKGSEQGLNLANSIQKQLSTSLVSTPSAGKVGDFYIVNCTEIPSVLIECGFLSNVEDEKNLISQNYQDKFCYLVMCGIVDYLNK